MTLKIDWANESSVEYSIIERVDVSDGGWMVTTGDHWSFFCESEHCDVTPQSGETVRLVGGLGYPIRGIEIGARCYRYLTAAEQDAKQAAERVAAEADRDQKERMKRPTRDAQIAALPPLFRERIERFQKTTPNWRRDHEPYEIFVCEQAVAFAPAIGAMVVPPLTEESARAAARAFYDLDPKEQHRLVPAMDDDHSGNTFGAACKLAALYLVSPELLPRMHGALCPLVGCEAYGCYAAYEAKSES